ncbi:hypothetical protein NPIL_304381 [Nephila pilipes]|uniref:Uncharacterized protein n=1 Tax=Nephila pilipes TaxID=299642 RepID=A0A8X6Q529_NEPPI|nr:hypothetical protein NPIL_304381 [Nephila pilipes]
MRDEIHFALLLERYLYSDIEEFKTFLNQFRDHLNSLQPPLTNGSLNSFWTIRSRRSEGPVQPDLPRWEDETIGHIFLVLLLRTRGRKRSRGGNVGRMRPLDL